MLYRKCGQRLAFFTMLLILLASFGAVYAQEPTSTLHPLPTLSRNVPFWDVFPTEMYCYDIERPTEGPTWGEIVIGSSSVEDLKNYVGTIGDYDYVNQFADYILFAITGNLRDETGIPSAINACVDIPTQTVTALRVSTMNRALYLEDLVAEHGMPDSVTWGSSNISRTVFWLTSGIAASVNILEQNPMLEYGQVEFVVYFPYQANEGFEERWPFNRTNSVNPTGGDMVYDPLPSEEQNPFDFHTMASPVPAQLSETPVAE